MNSILRKQKKESIIDRQIRFFWYIKIQEKVVYDRGFKIYFVLKGYFFNVELDLSEREMVY